MIIPENGTSHGYNVLDGIAISAQIYDVDRRNYGSKEKINSNTVLIPYIII